MTLGELRAAVAAALEDVTVDGDPVDVFDTPYDAVTPPALMVLWGPDPWLTVETSSGFGTFCTYAAALEVICVADRLTPEGNYPVLEQLVDGALTALGAARFRPVQALAPGPFEIAQVTYLAARLHIRQPVVTGGP